MKSYPHTYTADARGTREGLVAVCSLQLPPMQTAAPPEFDGPGGVWSPETLLCASLADCFILTFRAVARAARFEWTRLDCHVEGVLERVEGVSRFTRFLTVANLTLPQGSDLRKGEESLERADRGCLIANSLLATRALERRVQFE